MVTSPLELAASWIALEDVRPGTGELVYYKGSHLLEDHTFRSGGRNWNLERDGTEAREAYLAGLHERSRAKGLELETFLPKKGDALIWSADLAHGSGGDDRRVAHAQEPGLPLLSERYPAVLLLLQTPTPEDPPARTGLLLLELALRAVTSPTPAGDSISFEADG